MTYPSKNNKNYTIEKVSSSLRRKGVVIDGISVDIRHAKNLGIKSYGMIDFLRIHHKYHLVGGYDKVTHFNEREVKSWQSDLLLI